MLKIIPLSILLEIFSNARGNGTSHRKTTVELFFVFLKQEKKITLKASQVLGLI